MQLKIFYIFDYNFVIKILVFILDDKTSLTDKKRLN